MQIRRLILGTMQQLVIPTRHRPLNLILNELQQFHPAMTGSNYFVPSPVSDLSVTQWSLR